MKNRALVFLTLAAAGFAPLVEGGTTYIPVFFTRLLVIALAAAFLFGGISRGAIRLYRTPLDFPVLLFCAAALVSACVAPYSHMALVWVQLFFYYALYYYLARAAMSAEGAVKLAACLVLAVGAFEAAAGLYQWSAGTQRPAGTFFNPNMLAGYLVPAVTLSLGMLLAGGQKGRHGRAENAALAVTAALCVLAIFTTGSRGGMFSLAAGTLVVLWHRSRPSAAAAAVLLAVFMFAVPNPVRERTLAPEPFGYSRLDIWQSAVRMMADHPEGVGLGQFKYASWTYNFPSGDAVVKYGKTARTAHNEYLHAGAEMGVFGLAAFIFGVAALAVALARMLGRERKKGGVGPSRGIAAGTAGGIGGILAHGLVDSNLHEPGIVFLLILLVCMAFALADEDGSAGRVLHVGTRAMPKLYLLSGLLVALMLAWAARPLVSYNFSLDARQALDAGDIDRAVDYAGRAVMLEPGNASYRSLKAEALYAGYRKGLGRTLFDEATGELGLAAKLNPQDGRYPAQEARLYEASGMGAAGQDERVSYFRLALGKFEAASALNPHDAQASFDLARAYERLGMNGDAVRELERLRGLEPNFLRGRYMLALLYRETGKSGLALDECYSIMKTREALAGRAMGPHEEAFVNIDAGLVMELIKAIEGERVD